MISAGPQMSKAAICKPNEMLGKISPSTMLITCRCDNKQLYHN